MKALWSILLALLPLSAFEYGLTPSKVNDTTYCFFGAAEVINQNNNGNMVNSCFVDMGSRWLVIDSGPTYIYAKEAYTKMQAIKKQKIAYVINTHVHDDHWLGNNFYTKQGTTIVGSEFFTTLVDTKQPTRMQNRITSKAYEGTIPTLPNVLIAANSSLMIDTKEVTLWHVQDKAHTPSDLIVYIPSMQILFGGDTLFTNRMPSLRHGSIAGWLDILSKIETKKLRYIIAGHGDETTPRAVDLTKRYLVALKKAVKQAIEDGVGIGDAVKTITLPAFSTLPLYADLHTQNVETAYRELEWSDE